MSERAALDSYIETLQILARDSDRTDAERERDAIHRTKLIDGFTRELADRQRAHAEEEWTGSDARMILRRRVARHLADLIDPGAGPVRPDEETTP